MDNNIPNLQQLSLYNQLVSKYLDSDEIFRRELDENFVWFNGRAEAIEVFFKNIRVFYNMSSPSMISAYDLNNQMYNFWKDVGGEMARIHSGVPALISKTYGNLIKPSSIIIKVLKKDGTVDEPVQERLDAILEDNQWHTLSKKGVITESWGGFFFLKLSYMDGYKYPIIELVDPRQGRAITKRGRIIGYKFSTNQQVAGDVYEIIEKYELKKGIVEISYDIYKGKEKVKDAQIPDEIKDFVNKQKLNINFLPVFLKNNTAHSSKFPEKIYGESDYANSQSLFHILDSLLSNLELDVDNSKAIQFVNKNLMEFDAENSIEMYNKHKLRIFLSNKIMDDPEFDINRMIGLFQPELRIEKFDSAMKDITVRILANAGLSPSSVGMPGYESVNASNLSQTARRENSIISRDEKLELWLPFLKDFIKRLLQFDDFINGRDADTEYNIFVEYNKYMAPDLNTLINIVVKAVNGGVMSLEQAIDLMWPDKSPDEKIELITTIKNEMKERSTRASNALGSFDTPPKGLGVKTAETGRDVDEDKIKDLDKYKK
ncbi:MAG: hypothetical protein ACOYEB_10825 [Enterococcus lemanii]|jgi:hypothetical protein